MRYLDEVNTVMNGWRTIRQIKPIAALVKIAARVYEGFWVVVGAANTYMLHSLFFLLFAALQIYIVVTNAATGDNTVLLPPPILPITDNIALAYAGSDVQLGIAFIALLISWSIAWWRNMLSVFVGTVAAMLYAGAIIGGVATGNLSVLGYLAALYIVAWVVGMAKSAYVQRDNEMLRLQFEVQLAEVRTLNELLKQNAAHSTAHEAAQSAARDD